MILAKIRDTIASGILPKTTETTVALPEYLKHFDAITVDDAMQTFLTLKQKHRRWTTFLFPF